MKQGKSCDYWKKKDFLSIIMVILKPVSYNIKWTTSKCSYIPINIDFKSVDTKSRLWHALTLWLFYGN